MGRQNRVAASSRAGPKTRLLNQHYPARIRRRRQPSARRRPPSRRTKRFSRTFATLSQSSPSPRRLNQLVEKSNLGCLIRNWKIRRFRQNPARIAPCNRLLLPRIYSHPYSQRVPSKDANRRSPLILLRAQPNRPRAARRVVAGTVGTLVAGRCCARKTASSPLNPPVTSRAAIGSAVALSNVGAS
jgi:hypothetical protein